MKNPKATYYEVEVQERIDDMNHNLCQSKSENLKYKVGVGKTDEIEPNSSKNVSEAALVESLNILKSEYYLERDKRQSFENRAGVVVTVFAAVLLGLKAVLKMPVITDMLYKPITLALLIHLFVYGSLLCSFYYAIKVLLVKPTENANIDYVLKSIKDKQAVQKFIKMYVDLIKANRLLNSKFSEYLKLSQKFMILFVILMIIEMFLLKQTII